MRESMTCPSRGWDQLNKGGRDPTELEDAVLGLLEDAGVDTARCDRIIAEIDAWQEEQANAEAAARERKTAALCGDCPPVGYPTDKTRCAVCPRRLP
jgi:hypothetical protein